MIRDQIKLKLCYWCLEPPSSLTGTRHKDCLSSLLRNSHILIHYEL